MKNQYLLNECEPDMRWMEMIRLRTSMNNAWLTTLLFDLMANTLGEPGLVDARVYSHASFQSDLALSFVWDTDLPERQGSKPGLAIAQTLKEFGLLDHSVWTEKGREASLR
jgi:hypothetical protein